MDEITEQRFQQATGHMPIQDDLERANCSRAGTIGHHYCGWCSEHDQPASQCVQCFERKVSQ